MSPRHSRPRAGHALYLTALGTLGVAVALATHLLVSTTVARASEAKGERDAATGSRDAATAATATPASRSASAAPRAPSPPESPSAAAAAAIAKQVAGLPAGSVSVEATVPATGATFSYGAKGGMITASVVKLQFLETMLLQHHQAGTLLSDDEDSEATAMIENSDNGAAQWVYEDEGEVAGLDAADAALGVSAGSTVIGQDDYWGLTTTCAADQIALLKNLVSATSPLDAAEQAYALNLMHNVEADQTWGAPAAADPGTTFAVKNGWLAIDNDNDLWAVNSDAIITVHGQQVLLSVLTQHQSTEQAGIDLVQSLAKLAAGAVTS